MISSSVALATTPKRQQGLQQFSGRPSLEAFVEALAYDVNMCLQMFVAGFIRLPNEWGGR